MLLEMLLKGERGRGLQVGPSVLQVELVGGGMSSVLMNQHSFMKHLNQSLKLVFRGSVRFGFWI